MMTYNDTTPMYNLKAVVRETGLKPDTLRAWERRYGVPAPDRTDSGHRLYSQYDIETLKWLIERQNEGMSISRAVELWHSLHKEGQDPLATTVTPGAHRTPELSSMAPMPADPATLAETNTMSQLREAWISACINFDESRAEQFLLQAFALFPAEVVCLDLLQKGLHQIGEGWYQGTITVQQEHFASALAVRRMEALLSSTPAPTRPGRILVGCPPEEEHTFVPLLLSLLLRRRGWDVIYLGANVPLRSLELTLSSVRPNLVILTAQQLYTASNLLVMAEMLFNERVPLAFGGLVFNEIPDLTMVIPGHYLGDRLELATVHVEQVMTALRPQPARRPVGYDYKEALEHYRIRRAPIEAEVWEQLEGAMSRRLLAMANENFGRNITAALTLGNLDYVTASIDWIQGLLLAHYQMATTELWHYLDAYYMAALHHLEQPGYLILEWLSRLTRRETASHQTVAQEQK